MNESIVTTLSRLEIPEELHPLASQLKGERVRMLTDKPARSTVATIRSTWKVRDQNSQRTGIEIEGLKTLLAHLDDFAPQKKLAQVPFQGERLVGNIFFDPTTHMLVGAVVTKRRRDDAERRKNFEKMFRAPALPSRRSA